MIHAAAITESIVAPTRFRPAFSHTLGQERNFSVAAGMSASGARADEISTKTDIIPEMSGLGGRTEVDSRRLEVSF